MKKGLKIVITLAVVAVLVIGGVRLVKAKRAQDAHEVAAKVYPIVVKTMIPQKGTVQLTLPYLAEAHNEMDVTLSSRIASRVEQIVKSGTEVKKGQVVATLDTTDLTANIEALKVSLDNALKSHARTEALYKVKGASIEQLQKEQSQIASLKAKLKAA
ncbi:MAG TPA: biotin/lipoyl-binding protein, partial [Epsilonproteobacteria bacterium]|nr:biotin/lipoyl-binding protein [Campylobacterota bacterium]